LRCSHPKETATLLAEKVEATIKKYSMIEAGSAVLAAVSGGPDSVALLYLLTELRDTFGFRLTVAHMNHGVRGPESDADEAFVKELAGALGLDNVAKKVDAPALAEKEKQSLEEACRDVRRRFLLDTAKKTDCRFIATGHHMDDQAETVLLRLVRGAGVTGLAAIQPVTPDGFIRPLIECKRLEVHHFLEERRISFREDPTNLDRAHLRNRVRLDLLPLLEKQFNPSIVDILCRTAGNMADAEALLSQLGLSAMRGTEVESEHDRLSLDLERLRTYDESMWRYILRSAYKTLVGDSQGLTHRHLQALVDLVGSRSTGTIIHLPRGIRAKRGYGVVELFGEKPHPRPKQVEMAVLVPGLTPVPDLGGLLETQLISLEDVPSDLRAADASVAFFDMEKISHPLKIRVRKDGDRIQPFGLDGTKKLKDVLIELKVPHEQRDRLPVLADSKGILWVAGLKRSGRAKILPGTREVLSARWVSET
jgi:tRNA(Ile)-lysidine synthase